MPLPAHFLAALEAAARTADCVGTSRNSNTVPLQDTPSPCPYSTAPGPHVFLLSLGWLGASSTLLTPVQGIQLFAEPWHFSVIYLAMPPQLPVSKPTFPVVSGASPPGPGLSSAAPQWCRAFCAACTAHGCPCTAVGSSC